VNSRMRPVNVRLRWRGRMLEAALPPRSITSLIWNESDDL